MNTENSQAQMRKGILDLCVLALLSKEDSYVPDMIEKLKNGNLLVVEGTLYPLLTRLKNEGILSYNWVESRSGPPRKYYQLTPIGFKFLEEMRKSWEELILSVKKITGN